MRNTSILLMPLFLVGCATQAPVAVQTARPSSSVVVATASPTKFVETRYDVRGYREAANPAIRHEAHTVYRRTRVPATASDDPESTSRAAYAPVSYTPLPASEELDAELATQQKITADLRTMQAAMAETEQRMQAQYATLVRQSAEALKVREQLEAERSRIRNATQADSPPAGPAVATAGNPEVKW